MSRRHDATNQPGASLPQATPVDLPVIDEATLTKAKQTADEEVSRVRKSLEAEHERIRKELRTKQEAEIDELRKQLEATESSEKRALLLAHELETSRENGKHQLTMAALEATKRAVAQEHQRKMESIEKEQTLVHSTWMRDQPATVIRLFNEREREREEFIKIKESLQNRLQIEEKNQHDEFRRIERQMQDDADRFANLCKRNLLIGTIFGGALGYLIHRSGKL